MWVYCGSDWPKPSAFDTISRSYVGMLEHSVKRHAQDRKSRKDEDSICPERSILSEAALWVPNDVRVALCKFIFPADRSQCDDLSRQSFIRGCCFVNFALLPSGKHVRGDAYGRLSSGGIHQKQRKLYCFRYVRAVAIPYSVGALFLVSFPHAVEIRYSQESKNLSLPRHTEKLETMRQVRGQVDVNVHEGI